MQYLLFLIFCFSLNSYGGEIEEKLKIKVVPFVYEKKKLCIADISIQADGCMEKKAHIDLFPANISDDQKLRNFYNIWGWSTPASLSFSDIISIDHTEIESRKEKNIKLYFIPVSSGKEIQAKIRMHNLENSNLYEKLDPDSLIGVFNKAYPPPSFFSSKLGKTVIIGGVVVVVLLGGGIIYSLYKRGVFKKSVPKKRIISVKDF